MRPALLIVDDDQNILNVLQRELQKDPRNLFTCLSGEEALDAIQNPDIGIVLSDNSMPGIDGLTLLERIRDLRPDIVRLLMTGFSTEDCVVEAVNRSGIFGYLRKPWQKGELWALIERASRHASRHQENGYRTERHRTKMGITPADREAVLMLAMAAEAKDDDTGDHVQRVGALTRNICQELALPEGVIEEISFFSMVHDVGKIHIPDHILSKRGPLTDDEWEIMKQHTLHGERILSPGTAFETARQIARHHHERWDGSGYPDGLRHDEIPLAARIVAVADVYDALTRERPYKPAWLPSTALAEIKNQSGRMFAPDIVAAFLTGQDGYDAMKQAG